MKWLAIGLNVLLILTGGYLFASEGAPSDDEWILVVLLFSAPLSSLAALLHVGGESWVGLYFKRRAREEKQRSKSLSGRCTLGRYQGGNMQSLYEAILGEKNRIYYMTKFASFDQQVPGLKASWNWPALLAGGVWALYRKMYGWFFTFWGIAFLSNIIGKAGSPGLSAIILLVPWIAFPIYADSLYHNSIKKKIAVAQLTIKEESKLLEYLRYKGGVHKWVIWGFVGLMIIGILSALLLPMFARH